LHIYNGTELLFNANLTREAFLFDNWQKGSVTYDNRVYNDIPVMYDIYHDRVAIITYNDASQVNLEGRRVSEFQIGNHRYKYLDFDSLAKAPTKTGFYEALYEGKSAVYVRRYKTVDYVDNQVERRRIMVYVPHTDIYIRNNNIYTKVKSQGSVLEVFRTKKKELKQYISDNNIRFKENTERAIALVARHHDQLNN
jgi:hypothetical protein